MKIIITGKSGFVGQNLLKIFESLELNVFGVSLKNIDWISNIDRKADAIIHLAGIAHDTSKKINSDVYFSVNRDLTISLFQEFLKSEINDFIFFSSVKSVSDDVQNTLYEIRDGNPKTIFGKSKLQAEEYLLNQQLPEGKRLFIIRPCMIHGPGNKGNLNLLYNVVEKGIPWPLAAFENKRSFLSIDNLSYLVLELLINKEVKSGIYNLADDEAISTNELISIISVSLGKKPKLWKLSNQLIIGIAKIGDKVKLPLNSERLKKLTESYVVSNEKIKAALGIQKLPLSAEQGLRKTIISFKQK